MRPIISRGWTVISCVLAAIVAFSAIGIAILISPWFNWTSSALSDLGNFTRGVIPAMIFNTGLIVSGILFLIFSVGMFSMSDNLLMRIGTLVLILSSISLFAIGLFPETAGPIHFSVSYLFFVSLFVSMLITGLGWLISRKIIWLGFISIILPVVPVIAWSVSWEGLAVPETISAIAAASWVFLICWLLYDQRI